jgi:hypothetical protein
VEDFRSFLASGIDRFDPLRRRQCDAAGRTCGTGEPIARRCHTLGGGSAGRAVANLAMRSALLPTGTCVPSLVHTLGFDRQASIV